MRTFATFLLLAASALATVHADNVTEQQAMGIARQFIQRNNLRKMPGNTPEKLQLAMKAANAKGVADYYVFNLGTGNGFVIVGGDDRAQPVWAYSNEGTFHAGNMPENVAWWLAEYQRQLQFLRQHPEAARQPRKLSSSVEPLMTTRWKQSAPYNEEIPSIRFALGTYKPVVGCVALAMAQMMKAHNWPTTGEGSHSYSWQPQGAQRATTFSADFGNTTYQWASMKDSYTSSQTATAAATLCYHAGVAVDMQYNTADNGGSGAQIYDAMKALRNYFRYDKGLDLYLRDFYPLDTWEQMLRDDLDQGNPIIYGGSTTNMYGHCFVFDGYDTDGKFHINWGWGGDYDGWFVSSILDSGRTNADFSSWQQAILGAKPDYDGTSSGTLRPLTGYLIDFATTQSQVAVGGSVGLVIEGITFLGEGSLDMNYCGVELLTEDETTVIKDEWQADCSEMNVGETYAIDETAALVIPADIAEGTYHLYAVYSLDDAVTTVRYERPAAKAKYIKVEVKNGIAYFSDGDIDPVTPDPNPNPDPQPKTAADAYLDLACHASIGEVGTVPEGMNSIYLYTEYPEQQAAWITLSAWGVLQDDDAQKWFSVHHPSSNTTPSAWQANANGFMLGYDAYFTATPSTEEESVWTFYVTNCTQAVAYGRNDSPSASVRMEVVECVENEDGTPEATLSVDVQEGDVQTEFLLVSAQLDANKIYQVQLTHEKAEVYEFGFQTPLATTAPSTSIKDANRSTTKAHVVYDLQGRRIGRNLPSLTSHPSSFKRGVYIVGGKKKVVM